LRSWLCVAVAGLFVWFAGPYFAFADWGGASLELAIARVIAICVLNHSVAAGLLWRRRRADSKSEALLGAVAKQP